jgi:cell division transport system permease protein
MLEDWYSSGLPLGRGTEAAMAAKLLGWGREALAAFVAAGILALLVAVQVAMGVTRMTRRDDVRELRVTGASRSAIRWSFLAQGAALGLAGALVAFVLVGLGTWLLMRRPAAEPAFDSLPMVGLSELLRVLPVLVVTGLAASGVGTLLGARDLLRR